MRPGRGTVTMFAVGSTALAVLLAGRGRDGSPTATTPFVVARRDAIEVTLVEPGTLEAARSVTLSSEIRSNRAKIVSLRPDGSWVKPGDVILRFDRTPFEEGIALAASEVRDAEAVVARAEQERKLQIVKAEEALESARHSEQIARLNLETFEKGSGALTLREAEVRAAESDSELERERQNLADMERMFDRGFVAEGELARARLRVEELSRQSGLQDDRLKTTREVLFPRDLERARSELHAAKSAVSRAEALLYHTHEFYQAALEAAVRKVEAAREALQVAQNELPKTELTTPLEGFLILQEIPLDSARRKPQVGDSVWSGQALATIPDLSQWMVTSRVREVDLHRLREGMEATVDVEAYPDLVLRAKIDFIGSLAFESPDSPWKFFTVRLLVDQTDPRLRPGMSARVTFHLDSVADVVVVPLDAVFAQGDRAVCYVRRHGEVWETPVVLGKRNETHVEVRNGVESGQELLLAVPGTGVRRKESLPPGA